MRLIDADAVYKILESCEIRKATIGNPLTDWEYGYTCGIERAESEIECAPTLDAVPVRHGKWIYGESDSGYDGYYCSHCMGHVRWYGKAGGQSIDFISDYHYCPNCGARMDEE